MLLAGVALALGVAACGGSGSSGLDPRRAIAKKMLCDPPGMTLDLHNSGIPCEQAGGILLILSSGVKGPQTVRGDDEIWTCRQLSGARGGVTRCSNGKRFFTAERTTQRPRRREPPR